MVVRRYMWGVVVCVVLGTGVVLWMGRERRVTDEEREDRVGMWAMTGAPKRFKVNPGGYLFVYSYVGQNRVMGTLYEDHEDHTACLGQYWLSENGFKDVVMKVDDYWPAEDVEPNREEMKLSFPARETRSEVMLMLY